MSTSAIVWLVVVIIAALVTTGIILYLRKNPEKKAELRAAGRKFDDDAHAAGRKFEDDVREKIRKKL